MASLSRYMLIFTGGRIEKKFIQPAFIDGILLQLSLLQAFFDCF